MNRQQRDALAKGLANDPEAYRSKRVVKVRRAQSELGKILQRRRRRLELNQTDVATLCGMPASSYSKLETSCWPWVPAIYLFRLSVLLDTPVKGLLKAAEADLRAKAEVQP